MAETLYPAGYGNELVTMAELRRRYEPYMHPGYARRLFPWIESKNGRYGIGSGRRLVQPEKPGFAEPGKSFHQDQTFASGYRGYSAVDLVIRTGGVDPTTPARTLTPHSSGAIPWNEVPKPGSTDAALWGLHCNVSNEAWHMQPVEVRGYASWVAAGRPDPRLDYALPLAGSPPPAPAPKPSPSPSPTLRPTLAEMRSHAAARLARTPPAMPNHTLKMGVGPSLDVYLLQVVLADFSKTGKIPAPGTPDGWFGPATKASLVAMQGVFLQPDAGKADGEYGPRTHAALQGLSDALYALDQAAKADPLAKMKAAAEKRLAARPPSMPLPTLSEGPTRNAEVYLLQLVLDAYAKNSGGKVPSPGKADGIFGPRTKAAVKALQSVFLQPEAGKADGIFGPRTASALQKLSDALYRLGGG